MPALASVVRAVRPLLLAVAHGLEHGPPLVEHELGGSERAAAVDAGDAMYQASSARVRAGTDAEANTEAMNAQLLVMSKQMDDLARENVRLKSAVSARQGGGSVFSA